MYMNFGLSIIKAYTGLRDKLQLVVIVLIGFCKL